ncbi:MULTISPECIES: alpha/beta hydrolase [unclassified Eubacterium (in: firmicutes)]|uniref:alpha/beta fold hydrolase n=1 Tax=unclassified Eubacterium (in: firmicutes) TaxID=2624479 RepID=UPI0012AF1250|nr:MULTISPECIES: alpha/beta hydrolase [unclassified Eubacterium (in: firmicutes)]
MEKYRITVHEFGKENSSVIVMLHPLGVWWDIFSYVIPLLEKDWRLVIPAMPGHDPDRPELDFTSVEEIEEQVTYWLTEHGLDHVSCLYGCSMGGGLVTRMLASHRIETDCAVIDAGITPYQLPKPFTWVIGARDWLIMELGKHMSVKALGGMVDTSKYTMEDLQYIKRVFSGMSSRTIWRAFYSANNYSMPDPVPKLSCPVRYWYGDAEKKARKWDIAYIKKVFPDTVFVEHKGQDHAEYFLLHPEDFCRELTDFIRTEGGQNHL